jgi:hypothetical protein
MKTARTIIGVAIAAALALSVNDAFAKGWAQKNAPWAQKNGLFSKARVGNRMCYAMRNSSFEVVNPATLDGQSRAVYNEMVRVLRGGGTPGLGLALDNPGNGTQAAVSQTGGNCGSGAWTKIQLSSFKGNTISGTFFCPTSAHGGLNPVELAKNQQHTLWINQDRNMTPGSGTPLVRGQQTNTAWDQGLVTVIRVNEMPVKAGTNYLMFDPYPGKTAGVGGFPEGRIIQFDVK